MKSHLRWSLDYVILNRLKIQRFNFLDNRHALCSCDIDLEQAFFLIRKIIPEAIKYTIFVQLRCNFDFLQHFEHVTSQLSGLDLSLVLNPEDPDPLLNILHSALE